MRTAPLRRGEKRPSETYGIRKVEHTSGLGAIIPL